MQHHVSTTPIFLLCRRRHCSSPDSSPRDFAETLPAEMSERIFGELDTESLCSASCTCKLWHHIIEESQQLWRSQCLRVRAVCPTEVDRDRGDGLSWKVGSDQSIIFHLGLYKGNGVIANRLSKVRLLTETIGSQYNLYNRRANLIFNDEISLQLS